MQTISPLPRPEIDADGLLEYSVVYTDRSLNHMSQKFQTALRYISATLKKVYRAQHTAVVPGTGTAGMEAVARQFARGKKCLIVRNGFFSYRWSQILNRAASHPKPKCWPHGRKTASKPRFRLRR